MKASIVGGGLIGCLTAFYLLAYKAHQITLYDANPDNCSMAAAGMLSPYTELDKAHACIAKMGVDSIALWRDILSVLGRSELMVEAGSLVTAHQQDEVEINHFAKKIVAKGFGQHYEKKQTGLFFPGEAHIDAQEMLKILKTYLIDQGVTWRHQVVEQPEQLDGWVADCRGMGAKLSLDNLRAVRGETVWLHAPEVTLAHPVRMLHPRYRIYLVPRPDNIYIIGATEIETEDYSEISLQSMLELLSAAYAVDANFAEARVIRTTTQCRPTFCDGLPQVIKTDIGIAINGLYRHGYLLGPSVVKNALERYL